VTTAPARTWVLALLTLLLAAGVTSASDARSPHQRAAATAGALGAGDPYFPADGNGGYDVRHYGIHDRIDPDTSKLWGWTRITAVATKDLSRFNLDLMLMPDGVTVDGVKAAYTKPNRHELQVTPRRALAAGTTFKVRVFYHGRPDGLGWQGEHPWFAAGGEVMAMNEPHIGPWWFPADDHPSDKARFDISIAVPRGQQAISNGVLVSKTLDRTSVVWHWRARDPMATYLAFVAAGRFAIERGTSNGLPWFNAVSMDLPASDRARMLDLMRKSRSIVGWLSTQLGPYPFETTGGVVTSLFTGFALENQTRPTYPVLFGSYAHSVVVHELAHQWFGDDVAVRRWADIWLNEGFATFMEHRYNETHGGQSAADWLAQAYADSPANDQLWAMKIGAPGPDSLFDVAVYVRGAMTLQALRNRIGETDFWQLLRTWTSQHHQGNGSIPQFRALAEQISGEDLDGFFQAWLFTATKPEATADNGLS